MSDWQLNGQEEYLSDKIFYKVTFPEFWETAYRDKNEFYWRIEKDAKITVEGTGKWQELLIGERIQNFWHQHCSFCWEKALTYEPATFYCTEDMYHWICEECFRDFREQFHWQVRPTEELFEEIEE